MSRVDVMSSIDGNTSVLYCKSKLALLLRLGYLKPFLAGSKKTRQGPVFRVDALHISRCWFYLTVVASLKLIQKRLQNYIVLCYFVLWFLMIQMLMIGEWWSEICLWNDYANGRIVELVVNCDKPRKVLKLLYTDSPPLSVSNNSQPDTHIELEER